MVIMSYVLDGKFDQFCIQRVWVNSLNPGGGGGGGGSIFVSVLGHYHFSNALVFVRYQVITWTNVIFLSVGRLATKIHIKMQNSV